MQPAQAKTALGAYRGTCIRSDKAIVELRMAIEQAGIVMSISKEGGGCLYSGVGDDYGDMFYGNLTLQAAEEWDNCDAQGFDLTLTADLIQAKVTINTTSSLYVGECDLTRVILPVLNTSREDKAVQHPARAAPPTKLEGLKGAYLGKANITGCLNTLHLTLYGSPSGGKAMLWFWASNFTTGFKHCMYYAPMIHSSPKGHNMYITKFALDETVGTPAFCPPAFAATIDFGLSHGNALTLDAEGDDIDSDMAALVFPSAPGASDIARRNALLGATDC